MMLQLVSFAMCPFVHRATALLHEKGAEFETRYIDLRAKPDWFLAISPRGKVPVLIANEIPLFESTAILEFLDETIAPRLLPDDPFERARQRGWYEVANDLFLAHYKLAAVAKAEEVGPARTAIEALLARIAEDLRGEFFAGEALGLVDVALAPAMFRLRMFAQLTGNAWSAPAPMLAYLERLATRPSVVRGVPPDFGDRYRALLGERGVHQLGGS